MLCGGALMVDVERGQQLRSDDGMWWAVATMTTVGTPDVQPRTPAGRLVAVAVMLSACSSSPSSRAPSPSASSAAT